MGRERAEVNASDLNWVRAQRDVAEEKLKAAAAARLAHQQELADANQQLEVLRPGGLYAWKSKFEAAEAALAEERAAHNRVAVALENRTLAAEAAVTALQQEVEAWKCRADAGGAISTKWRERADAAEAAVLALRAKNEALWAESEGFLARTHEAEAALTALRQDLLALIEQWRAMNDMAFDTCADDLADRLAREESK